MATKKGKGKKSEAESIDSKEGSNEISLVAPSYMMNDQEARSLYEELAPALSENGHVQKIHERNLVLYSEEAVRERNLLQKIEDEGSVQESPATGGLYAHPAENVRKMCLNEMARQLKIMGLEIDQLEKSGNGGRPTALKPGGPASFTR